MKKLEVTYDELFQLLEFDNKNYNKSQFTNKNIFVDTPTGLTNIKAGVVKPKLDMFNIKFEDGTECNVADNHIFSFNGNEVFAKDAKTVDTRTGQMQIVEKTPIGKFDGYDINIDSPHWYFAPNDVIYHNSLFMTDIISGMIKASKNVLLISLEMADREIMKRVHANALDLPINSLTDLSKTEGELEKKRQENLSIIDKQQILDAYNRLKTSGDCGKFFVKDYPAGGFSALMLEQLVESYKIEKNIEFDAIFIDYLGIMKSDLVSPSAGLYSYVKSIGEEVRATAKKLELPIISASQLNRSAQNSDDADNQAVSDSIGTLMTADFMLFLLQNEEMKERKEIVCKCTKNRFTGRTDTWMMNVDYEKMRFHDMIIQTPDEMLDAADVLDLSSTDSAIDDDFGIITQEKQEEAEQFAKSEINEIYAEDVQKIQEHDKNSPESDPFSGDDLDDLYASLGL